MGLRSLLSHRADARLAPRTVRGARWRAVPLVVSLMLGAVALMSLAPAALARSASRPRQLRRGRRARVGRGGRLQRRLRPRSGGGECRLRQRLDPARRRGRGTSRRRPTSPPATSPRRSRWATSTPTPTPTSRWRTSAPTTSRSCSAARAASFGAADQLRRRRPAPSRSRWATSTPTPTPTSRSRTATPTTSRSCSAAGAAASAPRPTSPSARPRLGRGGRLQRRRRPRPRGREPSSTTSLGPAWRRQRQLRRREPTSPPATALFGRGGRLQRRRRPDLAVANFRSDNVSVLLGDRDGRLRPADHFAAGDAPISVAWATSTATPTPTSRSPTRHRQCLGPARARAAASARRPTSPPASAFPASVAVGDFNGDSDPDLAVANSSSNDVSVLLNSTNDPSNQPPTAVDDAYIHYGSETPLATTAATGVLANDTDPDGDPLTAALVGSPSNGSLALNADGSFSYQPNEDFVGRDSFTYAANDGSATPTSRPSRSPSVRAADGRQATITGTAGANDLRGTAPAPT